MEEIKYIKEHEGLAEYEIQGEGRVFNEKGEEYKAEKIYKRGEKNNK